MRIILNIPNDVLASLSSLNKAKLERRLLESLAIEGYQNKLLTQHQVMNLMGFTAREELWQFFKESDLSIDQTIEDL